MKDKGSIAAVDAVIAFGEGKIDRGELKAAAFYAASAAHAAAHAAATRKEKQKETADICRKYLSVSSDDFEGGEEKEEEVNNETI